VLCAYDFCCWTLGNAHTHNTAQHTCTQTTHVRILCFTHTHTHTHTQYTCTYAQTRHTHIHTQNTHTGTHTPRANTKTQRYRGRAEGPQLQCPTLQHTLVSLNQSRAPRNKKKEINQSRAPRNQPIPCTTKSTNPVHHEIMPPSWVAISCWVALFRNNAQHQCLTLNHTPIRNSNKQYIYPGHSPLT
jgi:hypothetical protein